MRLFTALDPSAEVLGNLAGLLERLRPTAALRWSKAESLHLTLKFIGEWAEAELAALREALEKVPSPPSFAVTLRGLGFFPHARAPRVFWVGVEMTAGLAQLASDVDQALAPLGIPQERRAYSPHLTLARIGDHRPLGGLHRAIEELASVDFGSFTPDRFYLYESRTAPGGSIYTRIAEFPW